MTVMTWILPVVPASPTRNIGSIEFLLNFSLAVSSTWPSGHHDQLARRKSAMLQVVVD